VRTVDEKAEHGRVRSGERRSRTIRPLLGPARRSTGVCMVIELGRSGYESAVEFEVGLELVLDGIEQLRAEWTTAAGS
jgi:hypothetical protein